MYHAVFFCFKNFTSDFGGTTQEDIFNGEARNLLNEAIVEHLMRQGQEETANILIEVTHLACLKLDKGWKIRYNILFSNARFLEI